MFVGVVATAELEGIVIGVAMLHDPREVPLLPRWLAWFMIVGTLGFVPVCVFTKTGPLAWNGATAWFGPTVFGLWFIAVTPGVLRAISSEEAEVAAPNGRPRGAVIGAPVATGSN